MSDKALALAKMPPEAVAMVARLEAENLKLPQVDIATTHRFHAGVYSRTIMIPAGVVLTGALIKIPTVLIISGDVLAYTADGPQRISGYHVLRGEAGRKQAFLAVADTDMTMIFPTSATSVEQAETEFTDEAERLFSRRDTATNQIEGGLSDVWWSICNDDGLCVHRNGCCQRGGASVGGGEPRAATKKGGAGTGAGHGQ